MVFFKKILVAFDGSENGLKALDSAREIAKEQQSLLNVLYVEEESFKYPVSTGMTATGEQYMFHPYVSNSEESRKEQFSPENGDEFIVGDYIAKQIMETAKNKLMDVPNVTYQRIIGNPGSTIVEYAEKHDIDLVIVGNRGVGAFKEIFMGSVSKKVTHDVKCSVLVVK